MIFAFEHFSSQIREIENNCFSIHVRERPLSKWKGEERTETIHTSKISEKNAHTRTIKKSMHCNRAIELQ
jgi:hypothetical protein